MSCWLTRVLFGGHKGGKKRAVCIGINDYPGTQNDLNECVKDATRWAELLKKAYKFDSVATLFDNKATKPAIISAFTSLVSKSRAGDVAVVVYSGHGTSIPDLNSDEPDKKDEAMYVYGGSWNAACLVDDELRAVLEHLPVGVSFAFFSDCCHSGTLTRALSIVPDLPEEHKKARFVTLPREAVEEINRMRKVYKGAHSRIMTPTEGMNHVLFAACRDSEVAYEGSDGGVFSSIVLGILNNTPNISYGQLADRVAKKLPSTKYPQTPQLECNTANRNRLVMT